MKKFPIILYALIGVINILGHLLENSEMVKFTKPMLMPALIFLVYLHANGKVTLRILLLCVALIFCWGGDLALMQEGSNYFLMGLGSFLIGHLVYIYVYLKSSFQRPEFRLMPLLPILTFTIFLLAFVIPSVPADMKIPVWIYALVITAMACMSRLREGLTSIQSFQWVMMGSLLFVVSDSAIAIDKFHRPLPYDDVIIMSTYIAGQLLIVLGVLDHPE